MTDETHKEESLFAAALELDQPAAREAFLRQACADDPALLARLQRLGIDYAKGQRGIANTANGQVVAHRVSLGTVRVGDVTVYNVDATIVPAQMDHLLLGNSFLSRFQMRRENDTLTLDKRF